MVGMMLMGGLEETGISGEGKWLEEQGCESIRAWAHRSSTVSRRTKKRKDEGSKSVGRFVRRRTVTRLKG